MLGSRTRKRNRRQDDILKKSSSSQSSHNREKGSSRISPSQKAKRRKTMKPLHLRLSPLERLPVELLQTIFELWPSPSLPQSSPILGRSLSSSSFLLRTCFDLWQLSQEMAYPRLLPEEEIFKYPDLVKRMKLKNQLLNCPWFNLEFTLQLELLLSKDFEGYALSKEIGLHIQEQMPTRRSSSYWDDCWMPLRLLKGPWKTTDLSLFILQCPRLNLPINIMDTDSREAAQLGILNCIKEKNWFILFHLLQSTSDFAMSDGIISCKHDILPYSMIHVLRDLQREPIAKIDRKHPCQRRSGNTFLSVTKEMLRSAVVNHGCDRGVVSLLLIQGLLDTTQVDYLDPVLWNWAEQHTRHAPEVRGENSDLENETDCEDASYAGWTDGIWLKMMLRAMNKFAEHIALPIVPVGVDSSLVLNQSYKNFQIRQAQLLLDCFIEDIGEFSSVRGNAESLGWRWRDSETGLHTLDPIQIDGENSGDPEALQSKFSGKVSLYERAESDHTIWINKAFNKEVLQEWLLKPYVGRTYLSTDQHKVAILKVIEVLEHTLSCDQHQRLRR